MGRKILLRRLALAAQPGRPILRITVPTRAARFLIAAGAQAAKGHNGMSFQPRDTSSGLAGDTTGADNPVSPDASLRHARTGTRSAEVAIATADPSLRLAVRGSPIVMAVVISNFIVRLVEIAEAICGLSVDASIDRKVRNLENDLDFACALDDDLRRVRNRARESGLSHALEPVLIHLHRNGVFTRARLLAEDIVSDLAYTLRLELARTRRDRDIDSYLVYALRFARSLTLALARDLALVPAADQDRDLAHDLARALARDLRARNLARARDRAHGLDRFLVDAISRSLSLEQVEGLASALLRGALDDFTQADLSNTDLSSVDLNGIRWSMSTRWPSDIDRDDLLRRSTETMPRSGIYVLSSPPDPGPVHHDVHA